MITRPVRCACFILLLQPMQPVRAQSPAADTVRLDSARAALQSIPLGSPIRVLTVGHSTIDGRLFARSDTGIVISHRRDSSLVSIARIAEIYRPAPSYKSGAIIGGVTGGVIGGVVLGTLATGLCETTCGGAFGSGATIGAAFGGALGAVIGIAVGSFVHHWEKGWP